MKDPSNQLSRLTSTAIINAKRLRRLGSTDMN